MPLHHRHSGSQDRAAGGTTTIRSPLEVETFEEEAKGGKGRPKIGFSNDDHDLEMATARTNLNPPLLSPPMQNQKKDNHSNSWSDDDLERLLQRMSWTDKISLLSGANEWDLMDLTPLLAHWSAQDDLAVTTRSGLSRVFSSDQPVVDTADADNTETPNWRWLRSISVSDGPHGVRKTPAGTYLITSFPATCFPTAAALAGSWDEDLLNQVGQALSRECQHYQVAVLLGPGMNLKRHPGGGRNFEYFSEDPYLTGRCAGAYIDGVQLSGHTAACAKHVAVNNQETHRFVVDAWLDERTWRELYLPHFQYVLTGTATRRPPETIMTSYNRVNGRYCSEHDFLMRRVLRTEWHYDGVIMTDWGATNDRAQAVRATVDLEMPGSFGAHHRTLLEAIQQELQDQQKPKPPAAVPAPAPSNQEQPDAPDTPTEEVSFFDISASTTTTTNSLVDEVHNSCRRLLKLIAKYQPESLHVAPPNVDWQAHYRLAHQVAMDCVVLLKNDDQLLPLAKNTSIALIGDFGKDHPRYQGMGSSQVHSKKVVTAFDELSRHTEQIYFAPGYHADDDHPEETHFDLLDEAVQVAKKASVVLLCVGLPEIMESEGYDRTFLGMPAQHNALVEEICRVHTKVVVFLSNGGAVEMPWYHQPAAILEGYLLGEAGGAAMVDLVFGVQSPCGKLAETFPFKVGDILADQYFPGSRDRVEHREGLDVGYRYFDTAQKPVRFPFGFGLSYTTFSYDQLKVQVVKDLEEEKLVEVTLQVTNTGTVAGKEIVQCYVHDEEATVYRPDQELRGFCKLALQPGETKTATMTLTESAFAFYDIGAQKWVIEKGGFEIRIGASSRDIRLRQRIEFHEGCDQASKLAQESYPPLKLGGTLDSVDDAVFSKRFGPKAAIVLAELERTEASLPNLRWFDRNSLLKEVASQRWMGKILLSVVYRAASLEIQKGPRQKRLQKMMKVNVESLPLRTLVLFSKGALSFDLLDGILSLMNRNFSQAWHAFVRSFLAMFRSSSDE